MAAGVATLAEMTPERYDELEALTSELREKLETLFAAAGMSASVTQSGSLFNLHFTDPGVATDLNLALLRHGILFTPRGMGCLSVPMTSAEIEAFLEATRLGLGELARA